MFNFFISLRLKIGSYFVLNCHGFLMAENQLKHLWVLLCAQSVVLVI